jgi:hypothetical protein
VTNPNATNSVPTTNHIFRNIFGLLPREELILSVR